MILSIYSMKNTIPNSSKISAIKLVAWLVGITGAWIVYSPLHEIFFDSSRRLYALSLSATAMPLFIGSTIIYLATLLHRRKRGAWLVSIGVFGYTAGFLTLQMILHGGRHIKFLNLASLILILMSLAFLYVYRGEYTVKSSPKSFWHASKKALLFMVMTFVFGVAGFMYLDHRDFNANIGIFDAVKYTYQELNFFTDSGILASTNRGKLFIDSLNTVGVISAFYMIVSLFSPIKSSLHSDESDRLEVIELLKKYPENTEDFFKIF